MSNMQTTKTSPTYTNELNGRKIVFVKMNDEEVSNGLQCYNCVMRDEDFCVHLRNEAGDDMACEDDLGAVWKFADEVAQEPTAEEPLVNAAEPALGRKFDSGKPMYALLPMNALEEVVKVLTVGATRYNEPIGQENWRVVPDADFRYYNATQRHIMANQKGERLDLDKDGSKGTNCYHLACAITSLMFRLQVQIEEDIANGTYDENLWKKAL